MFVTFPFLLFALSALASPGPNNLMIMYSGLNFGVKRSLFHFLGIVCGASLMLLMIALGFGMIFEKAPLIKLGIKVVGSVYMLFLAYKILRSSDTVAKQEKARPMSFSSAALFQLANPKAWVIMIAFSGMAAFSANPVMNAAMLATFIGLLNIPILAIWLSFGTVLERVLSNERQRKILNMTLGLLLALSVTMLWK